MTLLSEPRATGAATPRQLSVEAGFSSHPGPRERNEDYGGVFLGRPEQRATTGIVAAIADGVSSGSGARVAAELAVRSFIEGFVGDVASRGVKQIAGDSLAAVNGWIHRMAGIDAQLAGMATTLTLLILRGRTAHVLHVGDSRLYRWRQDELVLLTTDHILNAFDGRHVLTRSVGGQADVMVDYATETLQVGDRFLLCTDGVHSVMKASALAACLRAEVPPSEIADAIVAASLAARSSDNTSALVVDVKSLPEARLEDVQSAVAALPIRPPPDVGEVVDGFRMDRLVADGFYTRVFKATDVVRGAQALAKFPKGGVAGDGVMRQAFLRENWISALVRSPWVGEGLTRDQTRLFSLMSWYEGETLETRLARQPPLSANAGIAIAIKLIKGVTARARSSFPITQAIFASSCSTRLDG